MSGRYQDIHWLQKVYVDLGWTQTRIADECDVSVKTISNWIDKYDIERNRHDPEWLVDKYVKERLSQREIGDCVKQGVPRSGISFGNTVFRGTGTIGMRRGFGRSTPKKN